MKVYLDDIRPTPEGWTRTRTVEETIELLKTEQVEILSLDNDLGDGFKEGYEVMNWLEQAVIVDGLKPPKKFRFHTDNIVRKDQMKAAARNILRFIERQHEKQ